MVQRFLPSSQQVVHGARIGRLPCPFSVSLNFIPSALLVALLLFFTSSAGAQSTTLAVQVQSTKLRSQPRSWAPSLAELSYGDTVQSLGVEAGWHRAEWGELTGFIQSSALTRRDVVLVRGERAIDPTAQGGEIVLAGKGFAEAVETKFRIDDPTLDFSGVEHMLAFVVDDKDLHQFLKSGKLLEEDF